MKRHALSLVFLLAASFAAVAQTNFTFGPRPTTTNIAPMTSVNGTSVDPATNSTVDFQVSDFDSSPGFSLYFPSSVDGTSGMFEDGVISYGTKVLSSDGTTATEADTFSFWSKYSGTILENFTVSVQRKCIGRTCHYVTVFTSTGGSGQIN